MRYWAEIRTSPDDEWMRYALRVQAGVTQNTLTRGEVLGSNLGLTPRHN